MELWIRSQDKETLTKCEKIMLEKDKDIYAILNYIDTKDWFRLGLYKTKERALEVLDEIQRMLSPQLKTIRNEIEERKINEFSREILVKPVIEDVKICQFETYVYEMPIE